MDTPMLVESDVRLRIFAYQALSKPKIKRGPGAEAIHVAYPLHGCYQTHRGLTESDRVTVFMMCSSLYNG